MAGFEGGDAVFDHDVVRGDGHLGERFAFVRNYPNAVKRPAVHKVHRHVLGTLQAVGPKVARQHGGTEVHGKHHVDAFPGHVFNGGSCLGAKQRHAQSQQCCGSTRGREFHAHDRAPVRKARPGCGIGGQFRGRPMQHRRLITSGPNDAQEGVNGQDARPEPTPRGIPFHAPTEGEPCRDDGQHHRAVGQRPGQSQHPLSARHRWGFGCRAQSRCTLQGARGGCAQEVRPWQI